MKILTTPDPFLRRTAKEVKTITKKTLEEIDEMIATLKKTTDPEGVGLAATQVGIDKQIFVLLLEDGEHVFLNPKITKKSKKMISDVHKRSKNRWFEGCLSIPRIWGFVDRPYEVVLEYQTFDHKLRTNNYELITKTQVFTDLESAYVQHETDHLNGILFVDHILKQKGQLLKETPEGLEPISVI